MTELAAYRGAADKLRWQGDFAAYFELVKENPKLACLAHARVFDAIMSAGVTGRRSEEDGVRYNFFSEDLYGLDETLQQIVEYFSSAAQRLEVRKRILLLMGPVGGGKSTIVTLLKRGLERYSETDAGAIYAIAGCPMHEDPLHLVPDSLRAEVEREHGIYIEGDLCPHCRFYLERSGSELTRHP